MNPEGACLGGAQGDETRGGDFPKIYPLLRRPPRAIVWEMCGWTGWYVRITLDCVRAGLTGWIEKTRTSNGANGVCNGSGALEIKYEGAHSSSLRADVRSAPSLAQRSRRWNRPLPAESRLFCSPFMRLGVVNTSKNRWGIVGVRVQNPTDQPLDLLSVMYFSDNPNLQYSRRLWVPSRAARDAWFPALTTGQIPGDTTRVEIKTILFDTSRPEAVLIKSASGEVLGDALLPTQTESVITGVIMDGRDIDPAIVAMRRNRGLSRRFAILSDESAPPIVEGLQGLDELVLMSDRPAATVRVWPQSGNGWSRAIGSGSCWITWPRTPWPCCSGICLTFA